VPESEFDYAAIGIGPANLSLAALAARRPGLRGVHLERRERFRWHPGLLLPDATLQSSYLKDLVTPVDPTNPYSFLAFLVANGRFHEFLTADFRAVHRVEFDQYLSWAAERVPGLRFGVEAHSVDFRDGAFAVTTDAGVLRARHVVLGTGQRPFVPEAFRDLPPHPDLCHASEFLDRERRVGGRRVAVVGGGQSGAEIVRHLLGLGRAPAEIAWITRRPSLAPLDESAFANELFAPEAAEEFFRLSAAERDRRLAAEKYASDGIDGTLLAEIYRQRYLIRHTTDRPEPIKILAGHEVVRAAAGPAGYRLWTEPAAAMPCIEADAVVLATGYTQALAPCLDPLAELLHRHNGRLVVRPDYSLEWDGTGSNRIYAQNLARHAFGIADPNLSLLAWRSDVILTSIQAISEGNSANHERPEQFGGRQGPIDLGGVPATRDGCRRHRQYAG
jgi:lysine N6-hydroxylase